MADIIRINDDTWRFEDDGVRFFLFCGTQKAALIDTGMNVPDARKLAADFTDLPIMLIKAGKAEGTPVDVFGKSSMLYKFPYAGFL